MTPEAAAGRIAAELLGRDGEACSVCGSAICEDPGHTAPEHEDGPDEQPRPAIHFRPAEAWMSEPRPQAVIEGFAWAGRTSVLVAESGAGKTFLLLGAAAAVSAGQQWHGRDVQRGSVAYLSFEGDALGLRLMALRDAGHSLENVHIVRASAPLSPRVSHDGESASLGELMAAEALAELVASLAAAGRPPLRLVVIDTVRASLAGSEDSSEHVSAYLRTVYRLIAPYPDAAAVLAHHVGWQDGEGRKRRERGSSALRGNVDGTFYLEITEDGPDGDVYLALRSLKVRDDERPATLRLVRRRVELLKTDGRGFPLTSCVIERDPRSREDVEAAQAADAEAESQALDRQVLEVVRDHTPTSQGTIRELIGLGRDRVYPAVARLQRRGLIARDSQRAPYRLTPPGIEALR